MLALQRRELFLHGADATKEYPYYEVVGGERGYKVLCRINIGEEYIFDMQIYSDCIVFKVIEDEYTRISFHELPMEDLRDRSKYMCGIYFGGNRFAPQRIVIEERK